MRFKRSYPLFGIALSLLLLGANVNPGWSQSDAGQPPLPTKRRTNGPAKLQTGRKPAGATSEGHRAHQASGHRKVSHLDADRQRRCCCLSQEERSDCYRSEETELRIFADGTQQTITNFSTPEAPITVAMVVEYSKWSEMFRLYGSRGYEPGTYEVIRPTAMFLSQFIKPPDDYVSVVAFDIRPTPLTDFTNDPGRFSR
jgi:hypothetical protein